MVERLVLPSGSDEWEVIELILKLSRRLHLSYFSRASLSLWIVDKHCTEPKQRILRIFLSSSSLTYSEAYQSGTEVHGDEELPRESEVARFQIAHPGTQFYLRLNLRYARSRLYQSRGVLGLFDSFSSKRACNWWWDRNLWFLHCLKHHFCCETFVFNPFLNFRGPAFFPSNSIFSRGIIYVYK